MKSLKIKKLHEDAIIPIRAHETDVGYDLCSIENYKIGPGTRKLISTGISLQLPSTDDDNIQVYGRIAPRSGLSHKHGIDVFAGVIDPGYTGEIKVILFNSSKDMFKINKGNKIAQLLLTPVVTPSVFEVEELNNTDRSSDGFGSTDIKK